MEIFYKREREIKEADKQDHGGIILKQLFLVSSAFLKKNVELKLYSLSQSTDSHPRGQACGTQATLVSERGSVDSTQGRVEIKQM